MMLKKMTAIWMSGVVAALISFAACSSAEKQTEEQANRKTEVTEQHKQAPGSMGSSQPYSSSYQQPGMAAKRATPPIAVPGVSGSSESGTNGCNCQCQVQPQQAPNSSSATTPAQLPNT